jgi:hypothetical protein
MFVTCKIIKEVTNQVLFLGFCILFITSCDFSIITEADVNARNSSLHFVTWSDPCFDRAASIWLIKNFVDSTATFSFQKFGTRITEGIPFDVPGAELGRQRNISCFESIIQKYEIEDPAIVDMAKIIHDIDVNKWGVKLTNEADSLENLFMEIRRYADSDQDVINQANEIFNAMYKNY